MTEHTPAKKKRIVIRLFIISLIFVIIAASIAIIGCNYIGNRSFTETFYSVSSLKVQNKIRVIHISDLHNCTYGQDNSKLIDRVKKLKPDLIIYTGDIIDSKALNDDRAEKLCKGLSGVAPSYYIYGNNEVEKYYKMALSQDELDKKFGFTDENRNPEKLLEIKEPLAKKLEACGVKVLKNASDTIVIGSTYVDIFGVLTSNPSSFWSYAGGEFEKYISSNPNNLKITAIHEPLIFSEHNTDTWGDLILAGHTHGGIVKIPMIGPLYIHGAGILPERNGYYVSGRYEVQGSPLIISSGLENRNILRINNQPELVIVDINKF